MPRGEVLVCLVPTLRDWQIIREEGWYRIPVHTAPKKWPPKYLAFYHGRAFGDSAFTVCYYAEVKAIHKKSRRELFPDEPDLVVPRKEQVQSSQKDRSEANPQKMRLKDIAKQDRLYHQVILGPLQELPAPIFALRNRRIVFISTTMYKLETAVEINQLFDESPLEEAMWEQLRKLKIPAERQYHVEHEDQNYFLDFAIFCKSGQVDVETDGDKWHSQPDRIPADNRRNNALAAQGWKVLRFNTHQIREEMTEYCVPEIVNTINQLDGLEDAPTPPPDLKKTKSGIQKQMRLFERRTEYDDDE
ncbi:MAG: DUF559 domain-containing protein [Fimbriimonadales bacterium]